MPGQKVVISNRTPNDHGGIIPNEVIDFTRFNKNPVCLKEHIWGMDPIGMWTEIAYENDQWTAVPVFHGLTEESKITKALYEKGFLRAASIGGDVVWAETPAGQYKLDADGNKVATKFYLYEISIVTLPSNEDAVKVDPLELAAAKIYAPKEMDAVRHNLILLSSKIKKMSETKTPAEIAAEEAKNKPANPAANAEKTEITEVAKLTAIGGETITLKTSDLPGWLEKILSLGRIGKGKENLAAPTPKNEPTSTNPGESIIEQPQNKPTGLKAEKEKKELDAAKTACEKAMQKLDSMKAAAEKEGATEEDKESYKSAKEMAEKCTADYEAAEKEYDKAKEASDDDDDEGEEKAGKKKEKSENSANQNRDNKMNKVPLLLSAADAREKLKLSANPTERHKAEVVKMNGYKGKTFAELSSAFFGTGLNKDENDKRIMGRVLTASSEKNLEDYRIVLDSMLADTKYSAVMEKTRVMMNVTERQLPAYRNNVNSRVGLSLREIRQQFDNGTVQMMGRDNQMRNILKLNSTDDALASPALTTIEWLSLAIFKLFPSTSWKNDIPLFGAELGSNNTGWIWANIAADPAIYRGNDPSPAADYTYTDTPVAIKLTPYFLQPMLWKPLLMHQLRYDQMGTGWAQAFAKWGAVIDDNLIYTLASTVPAASIIPSTGLSGYQALPGTFNITGPTDPNRFIWNTAFVGGLLKPVLNDIIALEQMFNLQDFDLGTEKACCVLDPTAQRFIDQDPETKSLLTRWINDGGNELKKYSKTTLYERSRVAIYDPASAQMKDPYGVIPATSVSAMLYFIASQIAIGIGMLDVFMLQDPTNYGYRMSADIRTGIVPLRASFNGTGAYTYGPSNV